MDAELVEMLPSTVQINRYIGPDSHGDPTHEVTATSYPARIVAKNLANRQTFSWNAGSEELTLPTHTIWIPADDTISIGPLDLLSIPDPYRPGGRVTAKIFTVSIVPDENGAYYVKLACGWMYHRQGAF